MNISRNGVPRQLSGHFRGCAGPLLVSRLLCLQGCSRTEPAADPLTRKRPDASLKRPLKEIAHQGHRSE